MRKLFVIFILFSTIFSSGFAVKATEFDLKDQFSKVHSLENYKGKKVFLIFWASWCGYCQDELAVVDEFYKTTGENQKDVVFLTFNSEDKQTLDKFLKEKKFNFPVMNDEVIFHQYYIEGYPTMYIVDERGEVVQSITGKVDKSGFEKLLKDYNSKVK